MDAQWSQIPPASLDSIVRALGYQSTQDLPPASSLTQAQIQIVRQYAGDDTAAKFQQAQAESPASPMLDEPKIDLGDASQLAILIASLQSKISDLQTKTAQQGIKIDKDSMKAKNQENLKKIQDAIKKLQQADETGGLGKIFGWIGLALALVAAVAATVLTGGAAGALVGLVIVGISAAIMIAQQTGAMDKLMTDMFGDNDKAKFWFQIGLQIALVVAGIAAMALSGGASAAGEVEEISNLMRAAQVIKNATAVGAGAATITTGGLSIATGVETYQATNLQADSKELQAWIAKLQEQLDQEQDELKKVLKELQDGMSVSTDMLKSIMQSKDTIMQFASA